MLAMDSQNNQQSQASNTQNSELISNDKESPDKEQKQNSNLNIPNPVHPKLNTNSSLNAKADTNTSLNEQKKKEQSGSFEDDEDEDILYNDDEENEIFAEYDLIDDNKLRTMDDLKNINERIKNNKIKIEECKKNLIELKEEKKKKQNDIMNLLSNKESLEEIYKNQIYILNNSIFNLNGNYNSNNFNENTTLANDINNLNNLMNDNSDINLNSNHNLTIIDNEILNPEEENIKISLEEIKKSDEKKYVEQVINMFEDIFKKKDDNINNSISDIIKNSYDLFINTKEENNNNDDNNAELTVNNFFSKISLYISNQSSGKCSEAKINLLLRYLLKINHISTKLTEYIKFVNKKYKERKKELNDLISFLEKKNINLAEKNKRLENDIKNLEENKLFFDKNDNEELDHEVVIEYEDGLDKNAEINYEDDILDDNAYDLEKENELMNKGVNPYNNKQEPEPEQKKEKPLYKKIEKPMKQIIVKDNDEMDDKYLNEFLGNKDDKIKKKEIRSQDVRKNENVNININIKSDRGNKNNKSIENIKKIQYNNKYDKNIINIDKDKNKRIFPTPQHHIKKTEDEIKNLTTVEKDHYDRVQRIMNSGPKYGIFGVNNYNPENSMNNSKEGNLFSPKNKVDKTSNKIDKTVRIESRQNHNFIGIINMTKVVSVKKPKKEGGRKSQEIKNEENEGGIKIINLEQDFKKEEGNENEDLNINNNINNSNNNIYHSQENNKNKNEVQGYYLNIINSKKGKKDNNTNNNNVNNNNANNNVNNNNINNKEEKEIKENNEKTDKKLSYKRSYKSSRARELNLNETETKKEILNKVSDKKNIIYINNKTSTNIPLSNNDIGKRSHSISTNKNEGDNTNKNELSYRNKNKGKIIVINNDNAINNANINTPKIAFKKKIVNIPFSKVTGINSKNYNAYTYEKANVKSGNKFSSLNKYKK